MTRDLFQSVIVSTYNKPHHLELVFEGLRLQDLAPNQFEVVVADDGSGDETRALVDRFRSEVEFRVEHAWQEDEGFRAARVRNLGVRSSRGEQLIFLDGDCIPFSNFLSVHRARFRSDAIEAGDRLFLDRDPTAALTTEDVASGRYRSILPASEYRSLRWRALKDRIYTWTRLKERPKVVTANLAVPRIGFEAINGLDERFVGWGHEDEDLRRRLVNRGYEVRPATNAQVCHLWHQQVSSFHGKVKYGDNVPYFKRGFFLSRCRNGLTHRPISTCQVVWNGNRENASDERVEVSIAWGGQPKLVPAEVGIWVGPAGSLPKELATEIQLVVEWGAGSEPSGEIRKSAEEVAHFAVDRALELDSAEGRDALLAHLDPIL